MKINEKQSMDANKWFSDVIEEFLKLDHNYRMGAICMLIEYSAKAAGEEPESEAATIASVISFRNLVRSLREEDEDADERE